MVCIRVISEQTRLIFVSQYFSGYHKRKNVDFMTNCWAININKVFLVLKVSCE